MNKKLYAAVLFIIAQNLTIMSLYKIDVIRVVNRKDINGVYRLSMLQAQDSNMFKPMRNIEILKIFVDGSWISPAYEKSTKKVVSLSGGTYTYDPAAGLLTEKVLYNQRDLSTLGSQTVYKLDLSANKFYQSGIYKKGRPDAWKVEEIWERTKISAESGRFLH